MKIACLQMAVAKGDPEANLGKVGIHAGRAREAGASILLLPEMWSTGFAYREMPALAARTPDALRDLGRLAGEHGLTFAGTMPETAGGAIFNTFYVVDATGRVLAAYRKIHLFPLFKEDAFLARGGEIVTVEIGGMVVGLATCFDLRFPELFRKLALKGATLILVAAQWPKERAEHWRVLAQARAVENQVYVAACNASGKTGKTVFAGHSMIVGPDGTVLAEAGEGEELIAAVIDPGEVERVRGQVGYLSCRVKDVDEFLTLL